MERVNLGTPQIDEGIGSINYLWPDVGIEVQAKRLRDEGRAELWFFHKNGAGKKLLHVAEVNLLASATMTSLAKRMTVHGSLPWAELLTDVTAKTMVYLRQGEPGLVIAPSIGKAIHPGYYLEPVIMRGVPNVIFGDKGVHKTILSLLFLGLVRLGSANSYGLDAKESAVTGLLDWESNKELTDYNLSRLITGESVEYFPLPYLKCKGTLADEIERIKDWVHKNEVQVALLDSLGAAAGSDKFDSAGKAAALRVFECLRQLEITSLIIAQNAKGEDNKKTIYGSTFFTYYARNIFELKKLEDTGNPDESSVALIHTESNYSKKYDPMGFHLTFTDDSIKVSHQEVRASEIYERISQAKTILEFLTDGAKPVSAIRDELGTSDNRTRVMLSKLKDRGKVVSLGQGMWGLADVT